MSKPVGAAPKAAGQWRPKRQIVIVEMKAAGYSYMPNSFTVRQGVPVELRHGHGDTRLPVHRRSKQHNLKKD